MERNVLFAKQSFAQRIGRNPISLTEGLAKIGIVCKAETEQYTGVQEIYNSRNSL